MSVEDAVKSYLFNSQILSLPDGKMMLLCPSECEENDRVRERIEAVVADNNPIESKAFFDLRESMKNGGGPACLRLRVALNEEELAAIHQPCLFDSALESKLKAWVNKYYREELRPKDLLDPALLEENYSALDELTQILSLPAHYDFQR